MANESALRADRLLALWSDLSMRHVALSGACACGTGGISLRLDDFELDIVGYLEDGALRSGVPALVAFFSDLQQAEARPQPLRQILEDASDGRLPDAVADWLLPKVEKTLRSFAELHGPRGGE
ncbi:hypothetical protein [Variovorax ginsengisoli]|uniref:Uncharacterized protein n=1 Tax=Variovorax ginsengisoli TaxID=363844 RepID=A0ABT9S8X6_9BURK|nr:hypothetical protein [Variovorax ginsengisoli]MDP9900804.1 hypothetical protein [Variovorax ginsengisoli]